MDVQAPRDSSLRNIIDKLAEFVARNGPEFEAITKQKQQGNPKFDFLYGGEFANYYQYRVVTEQAFLKQNAHQQQMPPGAMLMQPQQQPPGAMLMQPQQQPPPHFSQVPPSLQQPPQPQQQQQQQAHDNAQYVMGQPPPTAQHVMWPVANVPPTNTQQPQQQNGNNTALAMSLTTQIEALNLQQNTLRDQIHQSEANLSAQHTAMMTQQTKQIDDAITAAQNTQLEKLAEEQSITLREFDVVLQPIIESCTKDSISAGKNWILQHSTDSAKNNVVLQYLLKKALVNGSTFQQKLHLIYLVNDILHHCMRKNASDLKNSLENVVIPMFCSADLIATNEQRLKLTKLLSLWESKAKFFDACVISKLQSPESSMQEYKTNLQNLHHEIVSKFAQATKTTLDNYQKQNQIFVQHATQQITQLEQQKQQLEQQKQQLEQQLITSVLPQQNAQQQQQPPTQPPQQQQQQQQQQQSLQQPQQQSLQQTTTPVKQIPSLMSQKISMPGTETAEHPPGVDDNIVLYHQQAANNVYAGQYSQQQQQQQQQPPSASNPFANVDARNQQNFFIPDMSKPPPGFVNMNATQMPPLLQQQYAQMGNNIPPNVVSNAEVAGNGANNVDIHTLSAALHLVQQLQQQQQPVVGSPQQMAGEQELDETEILPQEPVMTEEEQIPTAPYYDLPAGLMVPLIRLEDYSYKPLDPADIRLPPPAPQNERLTNAVNAFYAPPSHDRPRDNEGWEKLGLYEYYKVKNAAKKQKEEEVKSGVREKSRSPSPIVLEKSKTKKTNKRCYRSKSRSRSRSRSPYRSPYRSPSRSRSRSRSRGRNEANNRSANRIKQRNRSPRHDRDAGSGHGNRENRVERNNANNNSRRVERDRSPTPPSFFGNSFTKTNDFIEETNKGHQMLMKMGWGGTGTGLGSKNQGIDQPIAAGEVRDRKDLYKGVGNNLNDPFESFRKNKGAAFVHRMRTRDDNKS